MIARYFADQLKQKYPDWKVSENFYTATDYIMAVFDEGGGEPDPDNETNPLRPAFMIWLSSSDWAATIRIAYEIFKLFHNQRNFQVTDYDGNTFHVNMIVAETMPLRIGVNDGKMQYSINFSAHIREV